MSPVAEPPAPRCSCMKAPGIPAQLRLDLKVLALALAEHYQIQALSFQTVV